MRRAASSGVAWAGWCARIIPALVRPWAAAKLHGTTRPFLPVLRMVQMLLIGILTLTGQPVLSADEARFEVLAARTDLREGVYYLHARIEYDLPQSAREALQSGVMLTLEVQIMLERQRRWWVDKDVAELTQRYSVAFHALSQRYVVRNLNSGEQASYATLEMAEDALGEIRDLPVIDEALLEPDSRYRVYLRATLDIRRLPVPLRLFAAFLDDWRITSEWFSWRLR